MNKITCAIVEDDSLSLAMVDAFATQTGMLEVLGKFDSPNAALPWLLEHEVDLLFLDVEMPGMTGLEMLRVLTDKPEVIVISSNPNYAIEAFDLTVTDYLLKPLKDYARFVNAVGKVIAKKGDHSSKNHTSDNLFVKIDSLLLNLEVEAILFIEAFGDYIKIQTADKLHVVYSSIKKVEEKLDNNKFVRVHRSYVVNISKISNIASSNLEINKKIIPISETYKENLFEKLRIL
jgi:DNA-binding LytR/AlgR family response regulator